MRRAGSANAAEGRTAGARILLWPLLTAILFGLIGFGEPLEDGLRIARNQLRSEPVSGDIVVIGIDEPSLRAFGKWPWPRSLHADIVDRATELGAEKIVLDILYAEAMEPASDRKFAEAIRRSGKVTLAAQSRVGAGDGKVAAVFPQAAFARNARLASLAMNYNWQNAVWTLPYRSEIGGRQMPSLAAAIAGRHDEGRGAFPIDYGLDVDSIPTISAEALVRGRVDRSALAGKTVVLGTTAFRLGDQYFMPGKGKVSGAYIHVLGAETLRAGPPVVLGWIPGVILALAGSALAVAARRKRFRALAFAATSAALMALPLAFERSLVFIDVTAGLFLVVTVGLRLAWAHSRAQGLVNPLTGLPNLAALAEDQAGRDLALVAVRVHNYAEITSALDAEGERQLVEQIAGRLALGQQDRRIYQGDEGIFAWFAAKGTPFAAHLDALHALFRSPIRVGNTSIDAVLSFGVELGSSREPSSRLGSALVAADEADRESLKWKFHDPARLQDVPWRLSLLSQLDKAIDNGEVWLAFQPKLDLATRQTVGAEALARWTHPEKGPISPVEFVSAAEQHDRIERLTSFVIDRAVEAAARIVDRGIDFGIAVNLSARMLSDRRFPAKVAAILDRHGLAPERLTLELTETAAVSDSGRGLDLLAGLKELGVKIAIDDYGTGLSTLEYLKKIPASEIKIDQSFVKSMRDNRSDLIMVQSTIALAHSLGRSVVAEGVEDMQSLEHLTMLKCDIAQGFIVGRPMSFEEIVRRLLVERRRGAA